MNNAKVRVCPLGEPFPGGDTHCRGSTINTKLALHCQSRCRSLAPVTIA
jgi:hypothetical protein